MLSSFFPPLRSNAHNDTVSLQLVIDQGTILDRIDYNMEAVVEHTKTGIKQLEKAEKSQKSARPMKCIICLLCTIMILLLILVMKHRHH